MLQNGLIFRVHGWTAIYLDQPYSHVLIDHEVISKEFEAVFTIIKHVLNAKCRCFNLVLNLGHDLLPENVLAIRKMVMSIEVLLEVLTAPNIFVFVITSAF